MVFSPPPDRVRVDKWLWAARFFKTRTLASDAVEGGKAHLNGQRVKPSKDVKIGDRLHITVGDMVWEITVLGLSEKRGPAPIAQALYEETPESCARREQQKENHAFAADPAQAVKGRPTKKDRRMIHRFTGG